GEREGDRIRARADVDDRVAPVAVGLDAAYSFDEDRARRFDGDARENGAGRVLDETGNGALCARGGGHQHDGEHDGEARTQNGSTAHTGPPSAREGTGARRRCKRESARHERRPQLSRPSNRAHGSSPAAAKTTPFAGACGAASDSTSETSTCVRAP